ncbi:putative RING finger protein P8B7.23 [Golovinomyces cichoracearum]|uniref:Putative RING finger protein P8B7.23 n=1 Tax=Golovinomyces cichoracearum TaxID=62708 RepID=A0A420IF97_9PEZI|nr:putative RING finger protein P8B7.23 [Golovinomyces cichoracearum]
MDAPEDEIVYEDFVADTGVLRHQSSRRGQISITHLMNYTLPPLQQEHRNAISRERKSDGNRYSHTLKDRARYIHANYRFIVKPDGDYKSQMADTDQSLDWNDILQILISAVSQSSLCPICLSHPVAPRMVKCGHVMCLTCLIRFMHSDDKGDPMPQKKSRWKNCPICWDSINLSERKPVRWFTGTEKPPVQEGQEVALRLITRHPGTILALPRENSLSLGKLENIPWYSPGDIANYARIMKGNKEYMLEQYSIEIDDLKCLEKEDELMFCEKPEWTRKALTDIYESKKKIMGTGDPFQTCKNFLESTLGVHVNPILDDKINAQAPSLFQRPQISLDVKNIKNENPDLKEQSLINGQSHLTKPYFFYQSLPNYYLSPLDIRILKSAYGSFELFPSTLYPRLERVSSGHIMDSESRKRMKYLSHLPQGCEVRFLECNWNGVVAPEIITQFSKEIEKRRKRNSEKETREERDRIRAVQVEENLQWASVRSQKNFRPGGFSENPLQSLVTSSNFPPSGSNQPDHCILSQSTDPTGPKTVWGTASIALESQEIPAHQPVPHENDGWLQAWETEFQLENSLISDAQERSLKVMGGNRQSKKKAKKITLMSTNARRAA